MDQLRVDRMSMLARPKAQVYRWLIARSAHCLPAEPFVRLGHK
jgi:hypothetical protein